MRSYGSIALHRITDQSDGRIITDDAGVFDTLNYSRFKYGDTLAATSYGSLLASIIANCETFRMSRDAQEDVVVTASAYKSLPTAAQAVATAAIDALEALGCPVSSGRIHRDKLTEGDYGAMSTDERAYWMSCNGLWVDSAQFEGKHVIIVDDISISGQHERSVVEMFETVDIRTLTMVHVLRLDPELARRDPRIEDRMNHMLIKTVQDLWQLIANTPHYLPNARTVKFVLSQSVGDLDWLLRSLSDDLVRMIHLGVQADEYDRMQSYMEASRRIADEHLLRTSRSMCATV